MDRPLVLEEITNAVFSFKPFKAPGPECVHLFFYQRYWNIVGDSIIKFCHNVFDSQSLPIGINNTYLCLIPKINNANHLKKFRPIGLFNTAYKIITKIIANRLKPFLPTLVSPIQTSFN